MKRIHLKTSNSRIINGYFTDPKFLYLYFLCFLLLGCLHTSAQVSIAEDLARQQLFTQFKSNPPKKLNAENIGEFESLLLPNLSDFIISFDLDLKLEVTKQELQLFGNRNSEDPIQSNWLQSFKFPELIEIDQEITIQQHDKNQPSSIQTSSLRYSPNPTEPNSILEFKERFAILGPAFISNLRFLTIRQKGTADDLVWIYSPKLKRGVELTGSNRSDQILNTILSLEDIFFFGAKSNHLKTIGQTKTIEALVPEISSDIFKIEKSAGSGCSSIASSFKNLSDIFSQISLKTRQILVYDLKNSDPFSLIGRYRLFVSKDSGLPLLKQEYSHLGELKKVSLTHFYFLDSKYSIPVLTLALNQVGINRKQSQILSMRTTDGRVCENSSGNFDRKVLDPSSF